MVHSPFFSFQDFFYVSQQFFTFLCDFLHVFTEIFFKDEKHLFGKLRHAITIIHIVKVVK
jgi:hypothetical protein